MGKFSLAIPFLLLPPSYDFHHGYDHTTHVNIHYSLEFRVKVEGLFSNFDISLPITILSDSNMNSNSYESHQTTNFSRNSVPHYPDIDINDETDPPPSYDSIVLPN